MEVSRRRRVMVRFRVAGSGRLGDEKVRAVALGDAVGVGARLA